MFQFEVPFRTNLGSTQALKLYSDSSYFDIPWADESSASTYHAMLLPRLQPTLRAAITSVGRANSTSNVCLNDAFAALSVCGGTASKQGLRVSGVRHASHKAQGAVNKAKDGPGKRLGAKKSGGLYLNASMRLPRLTRQQSNM